MVLSAIEKLPSQFRYADLAQACPNVSRPTIKRVLGRLRDEGKIECMKPGPSDLLARHLVSILTLYPLL
jgi:hypothetical protein